MIPRLRAIEEIVAAVAVVYNVLAVDIRGRARTKGLAEARQCICYVARGCTRMSFSEIGAALNRDHTTIMACTNSASRLMKNDPWFKSATDELLAQFAPGCAS
jgi:chromosomal replication initiator protein